MFSSLHGVSALALLISSCLREATDTLGRDTRSWLLQAATSRPLHTTVTKVPFRLSDLQSHGHWNLSSVEPAELLSL